jgi:hypothetical protein
MIATPRNTERALRRASRIVLLSLIPCCFPTPVEPNPAKVLTTQGRTTPLAQLTAKAASRPRTEPGPDATPRHPQDIHSRDVHAQVRDLIFAHPPPTMAYLKAM